MEEEIPIFTRIMNLLTSPCYIFIVCVVVICFLSHCTKKFRKVFYMYTDRVMEDGIPFKAFLFMAESMKPEIRRFNMEKPFIGKLRPLKAKLRDVYPTLKMKTFTVAWKDEDDDEILMSSDDEVITMCHQSHDAVIKLVIRSIGVNHDVADDIAENLEPSLTEAKPVKFRNGLASACIHQGITCDCCGSPVIGFRYKCITCDDFDLCARCERNSQHPEHCVVRMPVSNMPLPLIKATIKKSRRFLKSVASQAHEESKKLRREQRDHANKTAADANTNNKGKKDSMTNRNWIDVCSHYMEEFTNLAGNLRLADNKPEPKSDKPGFSEPETAELVNEGETDEDIEQKPWKLPETNDLDKLEHACKFLSQYTSLTNLGGSSAEETTAESAAQAASPKKDDSPATQAPKEQTTETCRQDVLETIKQVIKILKLSPGLTYQVGSKGSKGTKPKKLKLSESAKTSGKGSLDTTAPKKRCDTELSASEIVEGARKSGNSSSASSCSCSSNHSDKAEGWTVIDDPRGEFLKDTLSDTETSATKDVPTKKLIAIHTSIYPQLNAATAVLNPKDVEGPVAAAASASTSATAGATANASTSAAANATASAPPMAEAKAPQPTQAKPAKAEPQPTTPAQLLENLAPHVDAAVRQMEAMGFNNENGWLSQLLGHNDGDIANVLDLITPVVPQPK